MSQMPPPTDQPLVDGTYYKNHEVVKLLGQGGTSYVHLLRNTTLNCHRVLKRGRPSADYPLARLKELFRHEYDVLNAVGRPYAPDVFDLDLETPELLMEYQEQAEPLEAILTGWMESGFPTDANLIDLGLALLDAVSDCHDKGIVLADLKPLNVLVWAEEDNSLEIRLIDFGSSVVEKAPRPGKDYTVGYAGPELMSGATATRAADVYSLGAILSAFFARSRPGPDRAPADFVERGRHILPALQELIQQMTLPDPAGRSSLSRVASRLRYCREQLTKAPIDPNRRCPHCKSVIRNQAANNCEVCGGRLARQTGVLEEVSATGLVDRIYEADKKGAVRDLMFYARRALQERVLTPAAAVRTAEVVAEVAADPEERDFAWELVKVAGGATLGNDLRRRYLNCLGTVLSLRKQSLEPSREEFRKAVKEWPTAEKLWVWYALATLEAERETVLEQGLKQHPRNKDLWYQLGALQARRKQYRESLASWRKALELGHRPFKFLVSLCQLAEALKEPVALAEFRVLLADCETDVPDEVLLLSRDHESAKDIAAAFAVVERGLKAHPFHAGLHERMADLLYNQIKYEMVVERYAAQVEGYPACQAAVSPGLVKRVALSLYHLGESQPALFTQAAPLLAALAPAGKDVVLWRYLVNCQFKAGLREEACKSLRTALSLFPQAAELQRLASLWGC